LASPKILSFGNKKKSQLSFCISLVYSYFCRKIEKDEDEQGTVHEKNVK